MNRRGPAQCVGVSADNDGSWLAGQREAKVATGEEELEEGRQPAEKEPA